MIEHEFTHTILAVLEKHFKRNAETIFHKSDLLAYLNIKTKSANRGSKSRASLGNHYALYVLIEDYLSKRFDKTDNYCEYEGAMFSALLKRQRELPFGQKLQNHALNHRLNMEFQKYFPTCEFQPILRNTETNRYWLNERLLIVEIGKKKYNIAQSIKDIIEHYVRIRQEAFHLFINQCNEIVNIESKDIHQTIEFIKQLLLPNVDARIFEITSYSLLKEHYSGQTIYWGFSLEEQIADPLTLYKTGRTNANDGGIDFVMKPLGRFFQVTKTVDANKYFLDIDKVKCYPITFVVKSDKSIEQIKETIYHQAKKKYSVELIVKKYMDCIEEIINIPKLHAILTQISANQNVQNVITEIILQSKLEFNLETQENEILNANN